MQQFGATGIPATRREADTRSPLDDDDEDLINPGSPNTFEDDISEDEVSLDARSSSPAPTATSLGLVPASSARGRPMTLLAPAKDSAKDQERDSPGLKEGPQEGKAVLSEPPSSLPTSLQALAPALTIASLVSSHKRPASPPDHYVTPIRPIPERHSFGYPPLQPLTKRPFTLTPMGPITDRHFLSSAGAFQPIRLQPKQKEDTQAQGGGARPPPRHAPMRTRHTP
ncbi:hypothetical protein O3P69_002318 [Scylla paramamosain]|uniref:Uncharacterized protein n=1 Tax=Scylla paramamosain TaxID=85552 RepID=A0AAW0V7L6_SCYPA